MTRPPWTVWLPLVFAVIVLSFVATTVFSQLQAIAVDQAAKEIADDAAPSIEDLTAARTELRHFHETARLALTQAADGRAASVADVEAAHGKVNRLLDDYLSHRASSRELTIWSTILREEGGVDDNVTRFLAELRQGDVAGAERTLNGDLTSSIRDLNDAMTRAIDAKAVRSQGLARDISARREGAMSLAFALDIACVVITLAGGLFLHRAMRRHAALVESHRRLLEVRAFELEEFAGRVAHDIRSPLGTASFALEVAELARDDAQRASALARGKRATARVAKLVDGLLGFAVAGARPSAGESASVRSVLGDLGPDLELAASKAGAELIIEPAPSASVACEAGVLTSIVSNLANNAIKYIGDGAVRRITIRTLERARTVRVEVADTGPGLPPGLGERVFEAYVRGQRTGEGIGLGLATVRRIVDAHGGKVGVVSRPGDGATFWFELPKAEVAPLASSGTELALH